MNSNDLLIMIPEWFQRVLEFPEIMKAYAYALGDLDGNVKQLWDNQYIQTCDEKTLELYEKLLGITPPGTETLEYRRAVALNKYSMTVPFSIGYLKSRLDQIYGNNEIVVDSENCELTITLYESDYSNIVTVYQLLYDIVPSHIDFEVIYQNEVLVDDDLYVGSYVGGFDKTVIPLDTESHIDTQAYVGSHINEYSQVAVSL